MKILVIGAHPDDIEYGMGGTAAKMIKAGHEVSFFIMTSGETIESPEVRRGEAIEGAKILGVNNIIFGNVGDSHVKHDQEAIVTIENAIKKIKPDRVYCMSPEDTHQDHKNTALATISAARDVPSLFFYETPSTMSSFLSQIFVDIGDTIQDKIKALHAHKSQNVKNFMDISAVGGLANFRGFQTRKNIKHAEAFQVFKHIEL